MTQKKNGFTYLPFSSGARNCPGQKFAMYEMKCILSKLLRNFEISLSKGSEIEPVLSAEIVLRPENSIKFNLKRRNWWSSLIDDYEYGTSTQNVTKSNKNNKNETFHRKLNFFIDIDSELELFNCVPSKYYSSNTTNLLLGNIHKLDKLLRDTLLWSLFAVNVCIPRRESTIELWENANTERLHDIWINWA